MIDTGFAFDANHPFHLHGHSFRVVAMERMGSNVTLEEVARRDEQGYIQRNLINPPIKDTVTVPDGGYTILRFQASNPGKLKRCTYAQITIDKQCNSHTLIYSHQ